jgi:hypothetical protein
MIYLDKKMHLFVVIKRKPLRVGAIYINYGIIFCNYNGPNVKFIYYKNLKSLITCSKTI